MWEFLFKEIISLYYNLKRGGYYVLETEGIVLSCFKGRLQFCWILFMYFLYYSMKRGGSTYWKLKGCYVIFYRKATIQAHRRLQGQSQGQGGQFQVSTPANWYQNWNYVTCGWNPTSGSSHLCFQSSVSETVCGIGRYGDK